MATSVEANRLFRNEVGTHWGNVWGSTPLHMASHNGHHGVVELLVAAPGIDVNRVDVWGETPLYVACRNGHVEVVRLLLAAAGVDVNRANHHGTTPLVAARTGGHKDVADMVAAAGGQTNYTLFSASYEGNVAEVVRELASLRQGCARGVHNVNEEDSGGRTALYLACGNNHVEVVRELIRAPGINVNRAERNGETPLYCAVVQGHVEVVHELLEVAAIDVNKADAHGRTPLWGACWDDLTTGMLLNDAALRALEQRRRGGEVEADSTLLRTLGGESVRMNVDMMAMRMRMEGADRQEESREERGREGDEADSSWVCTVCLESNHAERGNACRRCSSWRLPWRGEGGGGEDQPAPEPPRVPRADIIRALLAAGADVNRSSNDRVTPWQLVTTTTRPGGPATCVAEVRRSVGPILVTLVAGGLPYTAANKIAILAIEDDRIACRALLMRAGAK